jgi:hypothetical protein
MKKRLTDIYVDTLCALGAILMACTLMACCAHYYLKTPELAPVCTETLQPGHPYGTQVIVRKPDYELGAGSYLDDGGTK